MTLFSLQIYRIFFFFFLVENDVRNCDNLTVYVSLLVLKSNCTLPILLLFIGVGGKEEWILNPIPHFVESLLHMSVDSWDVPESCRYNFLVANNSFFLIERQPNIRNEMGVNIVLSGLSMWTPTKWEAHLKIMIWLCLIPLSTFS